MALTPPPLITIIFLDTLSILISSPSMPRVRACIPLFFLPRLFPAFFSSLSPSFVSPIHLVSPSFGYFVESLLLLVPATYSNDDDDVPSFNKPCNVECVSFSVQRSSGSLSLSLSDTRCKTRNEITIVDRSRDFCQLSFFEPAT